MPDFKKRSFNRDSRPSSFARPSHNRPQGNRSNFGGQREGEMFKATCSKCNKGCEVPFKPNGKKPVFCNDCFVRDGAQDARPYDSKPRSNYSNDRSSDRMNDRPAFASKPAEDGRITAMQKELASINAKLDVIIQTVGSAAYASILNNSSDRAETAKETKPTVKKVSKKAPVKAPAKAPAKAKKVAKKK